MGDFFILPVLDGKMIFIPVKVSLRVVCKEIANKQISIMVFFKSQIKSSDRAKPTDRSPVASKSKGVARGGGGSWGARDPPFVSRFLLKQPTIFRLRKREYPLFDTVLPPL